MTLHDVVSEPFGRVKKQSKFLTFNKFSSTLPGASSSSDMMSKTELDFLAPKTVPILALKPVPSAIRKDYTHNLPILDVLGHFSGLFYYCSSVSNSIGPEIARKAAPNGPKSELNLLNCHPGGRPP